jgi:hypothetical protein
MNRRRLLASGEAEREQSDHRTHASSIPYRERCPRHRR